MDLPRVTPIGLLERPAGFSAAPRRFSRAQRAFAALLLAAFAAVAVVTTIVSLGAYCLTTDTGDTRALRDDP